jgi:hypothetical protein
MLWRQLAKYPRLPLNLLSRQQARYPRLPRNLLLRLRSPRNLLSRLQSPLKVFTPTAAAQRFTALLPHQKSLPALCSPPSLLPPLQRFLVTALLPHQKSLPALCSPPSLLPPLQRFLATVLLPLSSHLPIFLATVLLPLSSHLPTFLDTALLPQSRPLSLQALMSFPHPRLCPARLLPPFLRLQLPLRDQVTLLPKSCPSAWTPGSKSTRSARTTPTQAATVLTLTSPRTSLTA